MEPCLTLILFFFRSKTLTEYSSSIDAKYKVFITFCSKILWFKSDLKLKDLGRPLKPKERKPHYEKNEKVWKLIEREWNWNVKSHFQSTRKILIESVFIKVLM